MLSSGICGWILFVGFLANQIAIKKPAGIFVLSLPFVLAIDNLFAGSFSRGALLTPAMAPVAAALLSASFALLGFGVGALLENRLSRSTAIGLAAILLCLAPVLF
jgi:hypothetical protein